MAGRFTSRRLRRPPSPLLLFVVWCRPLLAAANNRWAFRENYTSSGDSTGDQALAFLYRKTLERSLSSLLQFPVFPVFLDYSSPAARHWRGVSPVSCGFPVFPVSREHSFPAARHWTGVSPVSAEKQKKGLTQLNPRPKRVIQLAVYLPNDKLCRAEPDVKFHFKFAQVK